MQYKPNLNDTVERMKCFWDLAEPKDRIPIIIHLPAMREDIFDGSFFGKTEEYVKYMEDCFKQKSFIMDDYIPQVTPQFGHAIIAALCGAKINADSKTLWVHPHICDLAAADTLFLDWQNEWGRKFLIEY